MSLYVFSRGDFRAKVTGREASGLAIQWNPGIQPWSPALLNYCGHFSVLEGRGLKDWTLCVVPDGTPIAPEADADPEVQVCPERGLSNQINVGTREIINSRLAVTDWGVSAVLGEQLAALLGRVAAVMGHTPDFDPANFDLTPV